MADHDNVPYIVIERHSGGATPFLWGLLLGAGAALLFAPRSGEQTQEEIRRRARRLRSAAEERVDHVRGNVTDRIHRTRDQFQERIETVRGAVDSRTHKARQVMERGRQAASDAESELRRRVEHAREGMHDAGGSRGGSMSSRPASSSPGAPATGSTSPGSTSTSGGMTGSAPGSAPAAPSSPPAAGSPGSGSAAAPPPPRTGGTGATNNDVGDAEGRPGLG